MTDKLQRTFKLFADKIFKLDELRALTRQECEKSLTKKEMQVYLATADVAQRCMTDAEWHARTSHRDDLIVASRDGTIGTYHWRNQIFMRTGAYAFTFNMATKNRETLYPETLAKKVQNATARALVKTKDHKIDRDFMQPLKFIA